MKPFVFNFLSHEISNFSDTDNLIEYSDKLNLSVLKYTEYPAITFQDLSTHTMRKGKGTDSDTDKNELSFKEQIQKVGTSTFTRSDREASDSDYNNAKIICALTGTNTVTLTGGEGTDSDNQRLYQMLSTRTMTESKETTDSDS